MEQTIPGEFRIQAYRNRRFQNWIIIGFLYSLFYMTRYNLAANASSLMNTFGWTKQDYGIFEVILPLVYGLAVVINGPLADKFGGKKAFLLGAVGVIIMNFLFGNPPFKQISHVFSSEIHHLSKNHAFYLWKSPI